MDNVRERIERLVARRRLARLSLAESNDSSIHGLPLRVGRSLVLVQAVNDFRLDGYCLVALSRVERIRSGVFERQTEKMLRADGLSKHVVDPGGIDLGDWKSALRNLRGTGEIIILEWLDAGESVFFIGHPTRLDAHALSFRQFDAAGRWFAPFRVRYRDIIDVQLRSHYIDVWTRHVQPWKQVRPGKRS